MNWYKQSSILRPNETLNEDPHLWYEAIRLKNGDIIYDQALNHWHLLNKYSHLINSNNVESIGLLGGDGIYQIKKRGKEAVDYLFPNLLDLINREASNWYKSAQAVEDIPRHTKGIPYYTDVGHEAEEGQEPNFMWVFYNGDVLTEEETDENPTHGYAWKDLEVNWKRTYYGRFEGETGTLSILKPTEGPGRFRGIPWAIINKLRLNFPIQRIYEY